MAKGPLFNRKSFSGFFTSGQGAAGSETPNSRRQGDRHRGVKSWPNRTRRYRS